MNCFCPKCNASITSTLTEVPAAGGFLKCPECSAGFNLQRESFALRALRKGAKISCAECGSQLEPTIYCPGCHAIYPDYHLTETSSAAKKNLAKFLASLKGSGKKAAQVKHAHGERPAATPPAATKGAKSTGKPMQLAMTLIVLIALIGGGGFYYYQDKTEKEYAENYVRALYGIKTAADYNIKLGAKLVNDWRTSLSPTPPPFSSKEQQAIASGKSDIEILMKDIDNTPKKYAQSKDAIKRYQESYLKLNALLSTHATSVDSFGASAKKLEDDFRKSGKELKSGLPPKIADRFNKSLDQYKNLKEI